MVSKPSQLESVLAKVPQSLKDAKKGVAESEALLVHLRKLQPDWDTSNRLKDDEIPAIMQKIEELASQERTLSESNQRVKHCVTLLRL